MEWEGGLLLMKSSVRTMCTSYVQRLTGYLTGIVFAIDFETMLLVNAASVSVWMWPAWGIVGVNK